MPSIFCKIPQCLRLRPLGYSLACLWFAACAYDNEEEVFGSEDCDPVNTTYSLVIQPLIATNCALPSCHDGSNPALPNWTVLENVQAEASKIKERTGNRTMPPSNSGQILTATEIDNIACWVDSGAQNN